MTWVPGRGDGEDGAVSRAVSRVGRAPEPCVSGDRETHISMSMGTKT